MENAFMYTIKTKCFSYSFAPNGRNTAFIDNTTGENHIEENSFCSVLTDNEKKEHYPVSACLENNIITVEFDNDIEIKTKVCIYDEFITFTLDSVSSEDFHAVSFVNIDLNIDYTNYSLDMETGGFTGCLMGLTISTRMKEYPGRNSHLRAEGYPHIGLFSTQNSEYPVKAAVIGIADSKMRDTMKKVTNIIPDGEIPKSKLGGAYAYDVKDARRTYTTLMDINDTDKIIPNLKQLGITEIGVHQGPAYKQGDFTINSELYPGGIEEFKKKIKIYHENGIRVNLHTYTFFLDHTCKYITPVPHKDLDHICELTLTKPLNEEDTTVYVDSLDGVAKRYSYELVSSKYIQIGNELLSFNGVDEENNAFINCERGAQGTNISSHSVGDRVCQLKEYFCCVAPKAGSDLFYTVARNTAEFFNECDFDGFYLDAIDGVFALEGNDYAWYHAMDFIREMFKHLKKDPTFGCCYNPQYTASWYVRSRYGAFDSASRAHRDFIDAHVDYNNRMGERMYLPPELGWFDLYNDRSMFHYGWQAKLMPIEDVEYLCSKIVGSDCSMCYRRFSVENLGKIPMLNRYSEIVRKYDRARHSRQITPQMRKELLKEGKEFSLIEDDGRFLFKEAETKQVKLENLKNDYNEFVFDNKFRKQTPFIRIEPLFSAANYDEDGIVLKEFNENLPIKADELYTLEKIDSLGNNGLGVWVYGDGSGASLRLSLYNEFGGSPTSNTEFFIKCDFTGWKYFAFYECHNGDASHDEWERVEMVYKVFTDVKKFYSYYRDGVDYSSISFLRLSLNTDKPTGIRLKTVKLLPYYKTVLENPTISINGSNLTFKCNLYPETRLEMSPDGKCEIIDFEGRVVEMPECIGELPKLEKGENKVELLSKENLPFTERAEVTLRVVGDSIN